MNSILFISTWALEPNKEMPEKISIRCHFSLCRPNKSPMNFYLLLIDEEEQRPESNREEKTWLKCKYNFFFLYSSSSVFDCGRAAAATGN